MKKECKHQWTLDDAAGQDSTNTQLWFGCSNCSATRYIVLHIGLQDEHVWLATVTDGGIKGGRQ